MKKTKKMHILSKAELLKIKGGQSNTPASAAPMTSTATNPLYTPLTQGGQNPLFN